MVSVSKDYILQQPSRGDHLELSSLRLCAAVGHKADRHHHWAWPRGVDDSVRHLKDPRNENLNQMFIDNLAWAECHAIHSAANLVKCQLRSLGKKREAFHTPSVVESPYRSNS